MINFKSISSLDAFLSLSVEDVFAYSQCRTRGRMKSPQDAEGSRGSRPLLLVEGDWVSRPTLITKLDKK